MPTKPADADLPAIDPSAPETPASAPATIKVSVPQQDGAIVINTFDTKAPHRYTVSGGVIDAPSQADADLLLARVDGAKLTS